jgi:hypothetical protein
MSDSDRRRRSQCGSFPVKPRKSSASSSDEYFCAGSSPGAGWFGECLASESGSHLIMAQWSQLQRACLSSGEHHPLPRKQHIHPTIYYQCTERGSVGLLSHSPKSAEQRSCSAPQLPPGSAFSGTGTPGTAFRIVQFTEFISMVCTWLLMCCAFAKATC